MARRLLALLSVLWSLLAVTPALAQSAPGCRFILGFKTLHDLDPADVGDCTDNQAFAPNGDAQQHTTNGLLAWRKLDNWTAFTNGYWTWINGPNGLAKRLNTQRFSWEANPGGLPVVADNGAAPPAAPAPAPAAPPVTPAAPAAVTFGDGTHVVGKDVAPGTYRLPASGSNCYWARLSGFSGGLSDILANGNSAAPTVVTILPSDAGFQSDGCGTWTSNLAAITASPTAPFSDGIYIVGRDIAPGTWRTNGQSGCYWARLSNFTGGTDNILANDNTDSAAIVTIASSDAGFESDSCGTWTKVG